MFSFCLFVCLFGSRNAQKLLDQFKKKLLEVGTWATEESVRFDGNPNHATLRLGLG